MQLKNKIKILAFDADDTLWPNEGLFRQAERQVTSLLSEYGTHDYISSELYKIEVKNMPDYGFGAMAFTISMIETAIYVSSGKVDAEIIQNIINIGKSLINNPATPFFQVEELLHDLSKNVHVQLMLLTKGELLTQENKIERSGLRKYFNHIKIVSDKNINTYMKICEEYDIKPENFLMVGNSFKSDISPVLEMGGYGIYIPAEFTWQLEHSEEYPHPNLYNIKSIIEVKKILDFNI